MTVPLIALAAVTAAYLILKLLSATDIPKIKSLPEIPGIPIFGNLLQLGTSHATVAASWAKRYGPVFQTRLGNRRIVFVNSYDTVRHFWITHQSALISRPTFHTFHAVVSTSQGFTIGTSPWDESCKRRRQAAGTALNRPAVASYMPILDLESMASIGEMWADSLKGGSDGEVDPGPYFQRFALNTSLTLNYGIRIDGSIDDELLREIVHVEREVSNFRSTSNNWQDYVPIMRLWKGQNAGAQEYRLRRDKYMTRLLEMLKERVKNGTDKPCITGTILKDPESVINEAEIKSIGLSMVSAGIDTIPGNLIMGMASLATSDGQAIQEKAYNAIMEVYPDGDAWERCLVEEKVPYITALVKEILRYWTVIPICLPRKSIKDIPYEKTVIPAGTTFFMNAYAADYDESHFKDAFAFQPERFLQDKSDSFVGTPHYVYGAGSRMCAGTHLANRELYTAFIRLITAFEILPPKDSRDAPIMDCIGCNAQLTSLTTDPKPFKLGLKARNVKALRRWISESVERTKQW